LQNIYALTKANDVFNSTTVFGWSIDYQNLEAKNQDSPIAPINIDTPVYGAVPVVAPANFRQRSTTTTGNAFLAEQLRFLKDRLFVSGSFTALGTKTDVNNILLTPPTTISNREGSKNILAWSVLGKVTTDLGVYYSDSSNAAPTSLLGTPATAFTFREGKQKEFGAKYSFNKGRSVISAAVFDISVNNFSFANPAAVGASDPRIPLSIVGDFVSKGWELEFSSAIGTQWTLLGNYSHSKYRDTYGVRQRGTADDSAALFVRYDLGRVGGEGGLYFTAGFEYLGDRAGDAPGGFTAASTPTKIILNQPTFYVGSRKLLNLGAGYKRDRWQVDVYLQNALNEEYISATINRNLAIAGAPTNIKASFIYRF
jgi:iron complex outermembrane receptor protein